MTIQASKQYRSPHFVEESIPVEFLVLHYTAQSLKATLDIFLSPKTTLSAHLVISPAGKVYELVPCWEGLCHKAFHAGQSRWNEQGRIWENFNSFSIGIELVHWNGNLSPYSPQQMSALYKTTCHLQNFYPALKNPHRILGHEHIAGFRGKVDPGSFFDWPAFFKNVFPSQKSPERPSIYSKKQQDEMITILKNIKNLEDEKSKKINLILESSLPFWLKKWQLKRILSQGLWGHKGQVIVEYIFLLFISVSVALILIEFTDVTTDNIFSQTWKKMLKVMAEDLST